MLQQLHGGLVVNSETVNLEVFVRSMILSTPLCPCRLHGMNASSATTAFLGSHFASCAVLTAMGVIRLKPGKKDMARAKPKPKRSSQHATITRFRMARHKIHPCLCAVFPDNMEGWEGREFVWLEFQSIGAWLSHISRFSTTQERVCTPFHI